MDWRWDVKTFLNSLAGSLAAILIIVVIVGSSTAWVTSKKPKIRNGSYLVVELYDDLPEYDPPGGIMSKIAGGDGVTLQRVLDNLRKAQVDDRIEGVVLKVSMGSRMGGGSVQEIREAIKRLQKVGKKVYGYAESFKEKEYYLLAACDEILVPETAYISITGFARNTIHVKKALEKLGIKPNIHKIRDFKSAAELVTREDMSEPARENYEWMLAEFWDFVTRDLVEDRGFSEERIVQLMEHAMFTAEQAKDEGLIDRIMYWDQVEEMLKRENDDELRTVSQSRYAQVPPAKVGLKGRRKFAVVHAQGIIAGRKSGVNPLLGLTMGHETIVTELRRARKDDDIAAVIFRVDSQGGDALGSDLIGHEVEMTAVVKPVVVSMVDVAASGGYHISYRASKIVADPMTVTGSIGSISGKFNVSEMWEKLGVTQDDVARGPNALMDSPWRDYTPEERQRFEDNHWKGFNHWLRDVAEHRGKSFDEAEKLAHGRVWSGRQAVANGLVDELGDFEHAVQVAKDLVGIPADENVTLVHFPEKKSLVQTLLSGDLAVAARWAVYRAIREDVSETWKILRRNPELLVEAFEP
jgi:protease-4